MFNSHPPDSRVEIKWGAHAILTCTHCEQVWGSTQTSPDSEDGV